MRVGGVLDATQRHAVHQYAAMYNVDSVSVGPPNERGLVLSVPEYAAARVDPPQDSPAALEARCLERDGGGGEGEDGAELAHRPPL